MSYHQFKDALAGQDETAFGSFEVFWDDADEANGHARNFDSNGDPVQPGWYWWACFPGCLPDSEPNGPFETKADAIEHAQSY